MVSQSPTMVAIPPEIAKLLETHAKKHGLSLPAYIALLARAEASSFDPEFIRAARFTFTKYGNTLRRLAE